MAKAKTIGAVSINEPNIQTVVIGITGTAPLVMNAFPEKAKNLMMEKQRAGDQAKKNTKKESKDFEACYEQAIHRDAKKGWPGMPASAFRAAMISACRVCGFAMTRAKLSFFVKADGFNERGEGLVKINGKSRMVTHPVRNATGVADIRPRAMFDEWNASVTINYDADQFTATDIVNLMMRAGLQVGIGEGRPDSKQSAGMGWGTFTTVNN